MIRWTFGTGWGLAVVVVALSGTSVAARGAAGASSRGGARVELGRRLFFDPQVSRTGTNACVKCHEPSHGFSDARRVSPDEAGDTRRHSQTLLYADRAPGVHWDGEFEDVEALALARLSSVSARTFGGPADGLVDRRLPVAAERRGGRPTTLGPRGAGPAYYDTAGQRTRPVDTALEDGGLYDEGFTAAFGDDDVTVERIAKALAAYVGSLRPARSAYDRYAAGEADALSPSAVRGLALFRGRAGCVACHRMERGEATFSDFRFHDTGVAWRAFRREHGGGKAPATRAASRGAGDLGRAVHVDGGTRIRAFKTPTLRDAAIRPPYMHDGSFPTLKAVVEYYAEGASKDPWLSARIKPFVATDQDVADLVAFLEALTGEHRAGLAHEAWSARAKRMRLRFVDQDGEPVAETAIRLLAAGDVLPGAEEAGAATARTLVTDAEGRVEFAPFAWTHVRVLTPQDLGDPSEVGRLVPDTCREATMRLAVPKPR